MKINHIYIEMFAAEAFWNFVYKNNFLKASVAQTIEALPKNLWSYDVLISLLTKYNLITDITSHKNSSETKQLIDELYIAVANHIIFHNKEEKNIMGWIYAEDVPYCKTSDFAFDELIEELKTDGDINNNYAIQLKGKYLFEGDLMLRTPLPAGILFKTKPIAGNIYIPNTIKSLGFDKTIICPITRLSPLPPNDSGYQYFAMGIFYILCDNLKWLKLIPNTIRIQKSDKIQSCDEVLEFSINYTNPNKLFTIYSRFKNIFLTKPKKDHTTSEKV